MREHTMTTQAITGESPGVRNKNGPCDVTLCPCGCLGHQGADYAAFYAIEDLILHLRSGC